MSKEEKRKRFFFQISTPPPFKKINKKLAFFLHAAFKREEQTNRDRSARACPPPREASIVAMKTSPTLAPFFPGSEHQLFCVLVWRGERERL